MGCTSSSTAYEAPDPLAFLPQDATPYNGPPVEYLFVNVPVTMTAKYRGLIGYGMNTTTDIDAYYPLLAQQYANGYHLLQFNMIPGTYDRHGAFSMSMTYDFQGIFAKNQYEQPNEWQLYVIKSAITPQFLQTGIQMMFSVSRDVVTDTSHLIGQITDISSRGGRLICLEGSMQTSTSYHAMGRRGQRLAALGMDVGGQTGVVGIDLLFQLPTNPSPPRYTYQAVHIPITSTVRTGFMTSGFENNFDWSAPLQSYLSAGWKLVDVFYDNSTSVSGAFSRSITQNSVWFFEKEVQRLEDPRPQYQGAVIEYWHQVQLGWVSNSRATAIGNWNDTVTEMGRRGWELSCIVQTNGVQLTGRTVSHKLMLIFQRRIL
ncbi:uncharacterized protein [Ptychodera flava]|uniref:uncharacterized protein n=1 Tax=Ptychodera flava TaxID=63121 RepID=UPI00396A7B01